MRSLDTGLEVSFFHGPGESPDNNGDGNGVTSERAFNMGEDMAELGAEPIDADPTLSASRLTLGVLAIGIAADREGRRFEDTELFRGISLTVGDFVDDV